MTSLEEIEALLNRVDLVGSEAYVSKEGWRRLRWLLSGWSVQRRPVNGALVTAGEIRVVWDPALDPDVLEFRAADGRVVERVSLPAVGGG